MKLFSWLSPAATNGFELLVIFNVMCVSIFKRQTLIYLGQVKFPHHSVLILCEQAGSNHFSFQFLWII